MKLRGLFRSPGRGTGHWDSRLRRRAHCPSCPALCAVQGQSIFLSALRGECRGDRFWIPFSLSFLCLLSDGEPEDKQNSQKAGNAEEQQESWQHYNSQGMLRHTYDSS